MKWWPFRRRARESGDGRVCLRRALWALLEGDTDGAEEHIEAFVRSDSESVDPYLSLARLYRLRGEVGRAIRIHQNLLLRRDLDAGQRVTALAELAADFREGGFLKRAVASYQEVLVHDARHQTALRALVELLPQTGEYDEALALWKRLSRIDREADPDGEVRLLLGMAQAAHREGRHDAARKSVRRALRKDASCAPARILLAELEAERGRNKAAVAAWKQVAEEGGAAAASVYPKLAAGYAALDKARDYETLLQSLLESRPGDARLRTALAVSLAERGEGEQAVLELRRVLDHDPADLPARIALGRLLVSEGRGADALKEYGELLAVLEGRPGSQPQEELE